MRNELLYPCDKVNTVANVTASMSSGRGRPYSLIAQLRDLRYDVSQKGFVRGIPIFAWGQASRFGEIHRAARGLGYDEAERRKLSGGWNWDIIRGTHYRFVPNVPKALAMPLAFVWFYVRLFILLLAFIFLMVLSVLGAGAAVVGLIFGGATMAEIASGAFVGAIGLGLAWWLQSGTAETRPGAP